MATQLIIDWISITSHDLYPLQSYATHPILHDWENWKLTNGKNGYNQGAKHDIGVTAYKNSERPDMGTHAIYSGKTIKRMMEVYEISAFDLLKHHISSGHNIARIDLALDFLNCGLTVSDFVTAFEHNQIITRLRSATVLKSLVDDGYTFYLGSRKKRKKLVRIYNKGAETGTGADWVRVELQLMGKPATQIGKLITCGDDLEGAMLRAIKDVLDCPTIDAWRDAFSGKEPIRLQSESDIAGATKVWLEKQVFKALQREISLDWHWWIQYKMALENKQTGAHSNTPPRKND